MRISKFLCRTDISRTCASRLTLLATCVLLLVACDIGPAPISTSEPKLTATVDAIFSRNTNLGITNEELENARRKWREADINNYAVTLYYQDGWFAYEMQLE